MKNLIPITVYDSKGKRLKSFKAIHRFRVHYGLTRKLDAQHLKRLRKGEIIYFNGYILEITKRSTEVINPLSVRTINNRYLTVKRNNAKKLMKRLDYVDIIIFDSNFKFISSYGGTIEMLARKEKVSEGTIKASCHRVATGRTTIEHTLKKTVRYYAYRDDLIRFLKKHKIK